MTARTRGPPWPCGARCLPPIVGGVIRRVRTRALGAVVAAVLLGGLLGACGGGSPEAASSPTPTPVVRTEAPVPTPTACPGAAGKPGFAWPKGVPADLPVPPSGTLGEQRVTPDGLQIVQFSTTTSLREGVVFLVDNLARTGYTLGRGDAEQTEADAPFVKADLRGVFRMISRSTCQTDWLLALTRRTTGGTGSPLLPMRPGAGSPSPLPFG